jgi:hypothetical protein
MKMSVQVNGVFMPFDMAVEAIRRFCQPAMFHSESETFDIGPSGSTIFFRYRRKNFGLCTQHQFGSDGYTFSPEAFTLTVDEADGKKVGLSPNEVVRVSFEHEGHHNLSDFFLARFDDVRDGLSLRPRFLELDFRDSLGSVISEQIKLIVAIGFPTEARDVDLRFDEEEIPTGVDMKLRWIKLYLEMADSNKIDTPNRRPLVMHSKYDTVLSDPDGLSGAPVFFLYLDSSLQAHLGFAGIITHSNGHRFMVYEVDTIRLLLDRYIGKGTEGVDQ